MKTTAEMKIKVSNAHKSNVDDVAFIEASKLSLLDEFMTYEPKKRQEKDFKVTLTKVIKNGIDDFYIPIMDPSFADKEKTKIHYVAGEKPAVGKSYNWWKETVKNSEWCIGTKDQYVAFLGVLIKMLISIGWTCCEAWNAVCNDSKKIGHYWNSDDAKHQIENTGSREICGFFDLVNTFKILAEDEETCGFGFWLAGGCYYVEGDGNPLANLGLGGPNNCNRNDSVAWLVRKK